MLRADVRMEKGIGLRRGELKHTLDIPRERNLLPSKKRQLAVVLYPTKPSPGAPEADE
jgi:hypothetical protein